MATTIIGISSFLVALSSLTFGLIKHREVRKIRTRNKIWTWKLAGEVHNLMYILEYVEQRIANNSHSIKGVDNQQVRSHIARAYQASTTMVGDVASHLVIEFNVDDDELKAQVESGMVTGWLTDKVSHAIKSAGLRDNKKV